MIFSNHSIEQVTYLQKALFDQILEQSQNIQFLHIEPVGWQVDQSSKALKHSTPPAKKLGEMGGYNKNLVWLVKALQMEGKIADLAIETNYVARHNIDNSGTKVSFRKTD